MNSKKASDKLARELCSVRQKKIMKIKSKIVAGRYRVNNMDLAKALFLAR